MRIDNRERLFADSGQAVRDGLFVDCFDIALDDICGFELLEPICQSHGVDSLDLPFELTEANFVFAHDVDDVEYPKIT